MRSTMITCGLITAILISMLLSSACQQQPAPAEPEASLPPETPPVASGEKEIKPSAATPAPPVSEAPADVPMLSEREVAALIWSSLADKLPSGYSLMQFDRSSIASEYLGNGEWQISVKGSDKETHQPTVQLKEKPFDYWVEMKTTETTTCDLVLRLNYLEGLGLIDMVEVERCNVKNEQDVKETPVRKELMLNWIHVQYVSNQFYLEGQIRNCGRVPLYEVQVKFAMFDAEDNLIREEILAFEPRIIEPETTSIVHAIIFMPELPKDGHYRYLFLTCNDELFIPFPEPSDDKERYFHIGQERSNLYWVDFFETKAEETQLMADDYQRQATEAKESGRRQRYEEMNKIYEQYSKLAEEYRQKAVQLKLEEPSSNA